MSNELWVPVRNASRSTERWLRCQDDVIRGGGVIYGVGSRGGGRGVEFFS